MLLFILLIPSLISLYVISTFLFFLFYKLHVWTYIWNKLLHFFSNPDFVLVKINSSFKGLLGSSWEYFLRFLKICINFSDWRSGYLGLPSLRTFERTEYLRFFFFLIPFLCIIIFCMCKDSLWMCNCLPISVTYMYACINTYLYRYTYIHI